MEINVVEIYVKNKSTFSGKGEYVGRPTILSNPFKITNTSPRHVVVDRYAVWLTDAIMNEGQSSIDHEKVMAELERLFEILTKEQKLILICHCSPKICHAEIIKAVLENRYHSGSYLIDYKIGMRGL